MAKRQIIQVDGSDITLLSVDKEEYISLTDIANRFGDDVMIYSWMRNRNTVEFLGVWEQLHNPDFKGHEFVTFKTEAGLNNFNLTPKKWVDATNAIGILSKAGRYGGGTYAHQDIALEFCSWLSPVFRLYVLKEFQRLKEAETDLDWNVRRIMASANYRIHTEAVRQHLVPPLLQRTDKEGLVMATEADLLNLALFGMTAKDWRLQNPDAKGNIRDHATHEQLLVLSNLQSLNGRLLKWGCDKEQRLQILNETAIEEMQVLLNNPSLKELGDSKKLE
ncbi:MAG: KilA-N domain-containing protein [Saprospiraceae bacterium]|nr:KilA-N domain-containing protein [Saprospiraceae bacterium]